MEVMENRSNRLSWGVINIEANEVNEDKKHEESFESEDGQTIANSNLLKKKRKVRRGRREAYCPYYQLSEGQRQKREEREKMRIVKLREHMRAKGHINAPYNTNQFLMADHPDDSFEVFSAFEDESDFHLFSSPSDEEYMNNEFKNDYNIQKLKSLEKMNKEKLLREFVLLERRNERLEAKLVGVTEREEPTRERNESSETNVVSEQIMAFLQEIESLSLENKRLAKENARMKRKILPQFSASSSSSSSSSSESSSSSSSESSDEG